MKRIFNFNKFNENQLSFDFDKSDKEEIEEEKLKNFVSKMMDHGHIEKCVIF